MNTLVIVLIAAVCLIAGYTFYGSWLAKKWGIDPKAKQPAVAKMTVRITSLPMDGPYSPISFVQSQVLGPVTGAIQAAVFGWVPGPLVDPGSAVSSLVNCYRFRCAVCESVKTKENPWDFSLRNTSANRKKLFLLFCWLFTLIVIAAFADMVAGTFNAYETVDGVLKLSAQERLNGAAGSIPCYLSLLLLSSDAPEKLQ